MADNPLVTEIMKKPPEKWTMLNIAIVLGELYADTKHVRNRIKRMETAAYSVMVIICLHNLNQWLGLIPKLGKAFSSLITMFS